MTFKFEKTKFGQAVLLLLLNIALGVVPLFYGFLGDKYDGTSSFRFADWALSNPDVYFLMLSTAFISFIEYNINGNNKSNGIIFINALYVIMISAFWVIAELKSNWISEFIKADGAVVFLIILLMCAFVVTAFNLVFMNLHFGTNPVEVKKRTEYSNLKERTKMIYFATSLFTALIILIVVYTILKIKSFGHTQNSSKSIKTDSAFTLDLHKWRGGLRYPMEYYKTKEEFYNTERNLKYHK